MRLSRALRADRGRRKSPVVRLIPLALERLEDRVVPSVNTAAPQLVVVPPGSAPGDVRPSDLPFQSDGFFTPSGIETAYGASPLYGINFGGDAGQGQTIAVVDAYDDPAFVSSGNAAFVSSDLAVFDALYGLPDPPSFLKVSQTGSQSSLPRTDPSGPTLGDWETEETLDVEYAHAMAPEANILLVECNSDQDSDLYAGVDWAATPVAHGGGGATVISMSFGIDGGFSGETADDGRFSPTTYPGVTFLASAGDDGPVAPTGGATAQADYPADSPDVVAVGGTTLTADAGTGAWSSETAWNELAFGEGATGGGVSNFESQPAYQATAAAPFSTTRRVAPDVALDADPQSGVQIYDSYDLIGSSPYAIFGFGANIGLLGGTSLASPLMAGVVALADQVRVADGMTPLTGATQTLPILYGLYNTVDGTSHYGQDFNDITSGSVGGYSAGVGYDPLSGLGSPVVSNLAPDLATGALAFTSATSANFLAGAPDTFTVTDFGAPAPTLIVSGPAGGLASLGLSFNPADGVLSGTPTAAGVYTLTFTASNVAGSVTQTFTLTISSPSPLTRTSVSGAPNPVVFGQSATFTATVTNTATGATPTGAVQFFDDGVLLGDGSALTGSGASAVSTFATTALPPGPQSITAVFTGTGDFPNSTSPVWTEDVDAVTTTGVSSSLNPSVFGDAVTFTATVTDASGTASPTGKVEFFDGTTDLGPGTALTGAGVSVTSTITTSSLPPGPQSITAVYTPTGTFVGGSGQLTEDVLAVTTTAVSSSLNPSRAGQSVAFTATVSDTSGTAPPTGSVEFFDGTTDLGAGTALAGGGKVVTSTFTIAALPPGVDDVIAVYTPTGDFVGGQESISQTVNALTTTSVAGSPQPQTFGQTVTFTATVANVSGAATPTGSLEFFDGAADLGPGTALTGSGATAASTITTADLPAGPQTITAVYTPAGLFVGGEGGTTEDVLAVTTTSVASNLTPSTFGQSVTFTTTVTNTSGTASPAGTVVFTVSGTSITFTQPNLVGDGAAVTATWATPTGGADELPSGVDTVVATYEPAGDFIGGLGQISQQVNAITTTGVSSGANPVPFGDSVMLTAAVTNMSGTATPTGAVEFFNGAVDLGPGSALSGSGAAATSTITTTSLPSGADDIQAVYTPTGAFVGGGGGLTQNVEAHTAATVTANKSPSVQGNAASFTATVVNKDSGATPTGTVEFFDGTTDLGPGSTLSGSAASATSTFTTTTLPPGSDTIRAVYTASGDFLPGNGTVTQSVIATVFPAPPASITAAVLNGDGELDLFNQKTGSVTVISPAGTIASMTTAQNSAGQTVVFVTVTGTDAQGNPHTLWKYNPADSAWSEISTGLFLQISGADTGSGAPVLYGVVADGSLWEQNPAGGTGLNAGWTELSSGSFQSISPASTPAGVLMYGVVAGGTLWEQNPANGTGLNQGWTELSSGSFQSIDAGINSAGQTVVYGLMAGGALWEQNPADGTGLNVGWTQLSGVGGAPASFLIVASGGADTALAIAADHTLWQHKNTGWTQLSAGSFAQISATESPAGADLVFAALSDGEFWDYNSALLAASPWTQVQQDGEPFADAASSSVP